MADFTNRSPFVVTVPRRPALKRSLRCADHPVLNVFAELSQQVVHRILEAPGCTQDHFNSRTYPQDAFDTGKPRKMPTLMTVEWVRNTVEIKKERHILRRQIQLRNPGENASFLDTSVAPSSATNSVLTRFLNTAGLTSRALAYEAGLHRTYISQVEKSTRNVSIDTIECIVAALEIDVRELFVAEQS